MSRSTTRRCRSRSMAVSTASIMSWSRNGLEMKSTAPPFMARTDIGISPCPVMTGVMTASIAHEMSQPIAAMVANANAGLRWLSKTPPDLDKAKHVLNSVVIAGLRAGEVLQSTRAMFKGDSQEAAPLDINAIILEVL